MWTTRLALVGALTLAALLLAPVAGGQVPAGVPRIGTLAFGAKPDEGIQIFLDQLHKLGYIERRDIVIEDRYAEGRPERKTARTIGIVIPRPILSRADRVIR